MIDIDTHEIIDLIDSREYSKVEPWLASYKNLEIVSRDGSITYKNAISSAHPTAIQVSDRFHLLKNLTSYAKDAMIKELKSNVVINDVTNGFITDKEITCLAQNNQLTLEEKWDYIQRLIETGFKKTAACKQINLDYMTYRRLENLTEIERNNQFKTVRERVHEIKMNVKLEKIQEARKLHQQGLSMVKIGKALQISRHTVKKYIESDHAFERSDYGNKMRSILDPYKRYIIEKLEDNQTTIVIEQAIRKKGYQGSTSTLRLFCSKYKKAKARERAANRIGEATIPRKLLLKLLYQPIEKINGLSTQVVEQVYKRHPLFKNIIDIVAEFKRILKQKAIEKFDQWLNKAMKLDNPFINSFINGVTRDITAVKNAIRYDYNNGLAEGSVNKLKVIKRIMYGRCSFNLLKEKILKLERGIN